MDETLRLKKEVTKMIQDLQDYELESIKDFIKERILGKKVVLENKKYIGIDYDGVLHNYTHWNDGKLNGPVPGAIEWFKKICEKEDWRISIVSARAANKEGRDTIYNSLIEWGVPKETLSKVTITNIKEPLWILIDDRCYIMQGKFPTIEQIDNFKSWTEKNESHVN